MPPSITTMPMHADAAAPPRMLLTQPVIALIAFLTMVDLFATQAILPFLATRYAVSPSVMANAVNAATFGMAVAGFAVACLGEGADRRAWIGLALAVLAIPTLLLASMPTLWAFAALRVMQGFLMATAFSLTLAYLGEACSTRATAGAFAAYVTGNVAANLFGRLLSTSVAEGLGLPANFIVFALLNLAGAALVWRCLRHRAAYAGATLVSPLAAWRAHLRNPLLLTTLAIGFCLLFIFIGTFSFVNFSLVRPPLALHPMWLGIVCAVFLPAIFTTRQAGGLVARLGRRNAMFAALFLAMAGLPLLVLPALPAVLAGLVLVGIGTFLAQAIGTGVVGVAARMDRASASGLYLSAYYLGGLIGTAVLGHIHDHHGWPATVAAIGVAGLAALGLAARLPSAKS